MDVKLIRALAFHLYLLSLAVCPKAHGPESAKAAREPNVRFRTSRPQSRPSEIHPLQTFKPRHSPSVTTKGDQAFRQPPALPVCPLSP